MKVYLIGAYTRKERIAAIKIGIAREPMRRLAELQTGNHLELRVIATWTAKSDRYALDVEQWAHRVFQKYRISGEWFKPKGLDRYVGFLNSRLAEQRLHEDERQEELAAELLDREMLTDINRIYN